MNKSKTLKKTRLGLGVYTVSAMLTGTLSQGVVSQEAALEEVVVTGSRIVRRDLSAPSPIVTISSESFDNSSTTGVETVLNQLPQFVPAGTQFAGGTGDIQNSATNTPGAATLNLRGLGSNRNLVLIDGKRAQPSNALLVVDINTIPKSAIANVEVITGGASAVYGPDAMAGVVNFTLKDDFEGIELDLQTAQTAEGDGEESAISLLMGMNSADGRGNVMIGLDWTERDAVLQRDRDFFIKGWTDPRNPGGDFIMPPAYFQGGNHASQAAIDALFPGAPAGTVSTSTEIYFNQDGSPFVVAGGLGYNGPFNCLDCGDYSMIKQLENGNLDQRGRSVNNWLSQPMDRNSVFLRGNYDMTENVGVFAQANYSNIEVQTRALVPPAITVWQAPSVPRDGRPLPAALNALLDSRIQRDQNGDPVLDGGGNTISTADAPWALFHVLDYNGPIQQTNTSNVWQLMAGLQGELKGGDWTWEVYASRGDTDIVAKNKNMPSLQRYQELVYADNFGDVDGFAPAGSGRGYQLNCETGLPVFDDFTPSQDCLDSIDTRMINRNHLTQDIVEANLQGGMGQLFELPGGEIRFALGASYRENSYSFEPGNPLSQIRDNPIGVFASNGTGGEIDVKEYYGELLVPVFDILTLELGYRYSDFSTAGGHDTYKALFTVEPLDWLTVRGGFQRATRAPNVAELFTAPTQEVVGHPDQDPCSVTTLSPWGNVPSNPDRQQVQDLCRAIIGNSTSGFDTNTYNATVEDIMATGPDGFTRQNPRFFPLEIALRQGNTDVAPEQGDTFTLGAVLSEPLGVENLSLTIDYYNIEIKDAIQPFLVSTVYDNCFNYNGLSNPSYDVNNEWCQMIRRNPVTGDREEVDTPFENIGTLETQGIDLNVNWATNIGPGVFNVNTSFNFLLNFEYQVAPGGRVIDATGTLDSAGQPGNGALFDYQALTSFSYSLDDLTLGLSWRHLDSADSAAAAQSPGTTIQGPGSYDLFNFNANYNWDRYTFRFGIDNLFDADPELTQSNPNGLAGGDTNSDITDPALYDLMGRNFYLGIKASF